MYLSKYGVARKIRIPMVKRAVVDHAIGADWTPAAGDVKITKDGGAAANVTNLPTAIAMGNSAVWEFSLTATEMQAAEIVVTIADSATKAVEDNAFAIETYGNPSAQHAADLSDGVRLGLTALPNAAAEAAGGLYTRGAGAGQINQPANGMVDANVVRNAGTAITAAAGRQEVNVSHFGGTAGAFAGGRPEVNTSHVGGTAQTAGDIPARLPAALTANGNMKSSLMEILATALTETAGQLAGGFKKFFNIGAPAATMDHLVLVDTATAVTNRVTANTDQIEGADATNQIRDSILNDATRFAGADVASIKAKTDNLPSDPADESLIIAATDAVMSRLGAPAGASHAADVAAVKSDTAAVKAKTDQLAFTVAGELDSNARSVNDVRLQGVGTAGNSWRPA